MDRRTIAGLQVLLTLSTAGFACTGSFLAVFYRERGFSTTHMGLLFPAPPSLVWLRSPSGDFLPTRAGARNDCLSCCFRSPRCWRSSCPCRKVSA